MASSCLCGKALAFGDIQEGSIYCSTACARLDSMSALCAYETFQITTASRMKQVFRIGRKENLAKATHYRRQAREPKAAFPSVSATSAGSIPKLNNSRPVVPKIVPDEAAILQTARLQPLPKTLKPLLLAPSLAPNSYKKPSQPVSSNKFVPVLLHAENRQRQSEEDDSDDDASFYDEDSRETPRLTDKVCSYFSDTTFASQDFPSSSSSTSLSDGETLSYSSSATSLVSTASSVDLLDRDLGSQIVFADVCKPASTKEALDTVARKEDAHSNTRGYLEQRRPNLGYHSSIADENCHQIDIPVLDMLDPLFQLFEDFDLSEV